MSRRISLLGLILVAALSCSKRVIQAGGLELKITTDLPASDLNKVHLEISQESAPGVWHKLLDRVPLVPREVTLPSSLSITAGDDPNQGALIVITGLKVVTGQGDQELVQRVVQTQVPSNRIAQLEIVLAKACEFKVGACPTGQSCQPSTGTCGSNVVDSSTLPAYAPKDDVSSPGTVLATGQEAANNIVVDAVNIYWTTQSNETYSVMKMPIAGRTPQVLATGPGNIAGLATDETNVYWNPNYAGVDIMKVPIGGGAPVALTTRPTRPGDRSCCVAVAGGVLYWSYGTSGVAEDAVMDLSVFAATTPKGGGELVPQPGRVIAPTQDLPSGIAVSSENVFWVSAAGLQRIPLDGSSGPISIPLPLRDVKTQLDWDVAADDKFVYWTSECIAYRTDVGGQSTPLAGMPRFCDSSSAGIASDRENLFWGVMLLSNADYMGGAIFTAPIMSSGNAARTIALLPNSFPTSLAIDATHVYWTQVNEVMMAPKN